MEFKIFLTENSLLGNCSQKVSSFVHGAFNILTNVKVGKYSIQTIARESFGLACGVVDENKHYYETGLEKYHSLANEFATKKKEFSNRYDDAKKFIHSVLSQLIVFVLSVLNFFFGKYFKIVQDKADAARSTMNSRYQEANAYINNKVASTTEAFNTQKRYIDARINALEETVKEQVSTKRREIVSQVKEFTQPYVEQAKPYVEQAVTYAQPVVEKAKPYVDQAMPYLRPYVEKLLVLMDKYEIPFLREWIEDFIALPAKPVESFLPLQKEEDAIIQEEQGEEEEATKDTAESEEQQEEVEEEDSEESSE